jgi:glycosyltransferase involved in cell wall biosynthesis
MRSPQLADNRPANGSIVSNLATYFIFLLSQPMEPLVSILIPCYNAEKWIEEAINSALSQTYGNFEVIVVDDGSKDNSVEIIQRFGSRIRWETRPNHGANATRNRLLELSQGEWVQYLDADDYLQPHKIKRQIEFIVQNPQTDLVYSPSLLQQHNYLVEAILKNRQPKRSPDFPQTLNLEPPDNIVQEVLPIPKPHDPWILLTRWYLPQTGSPLWRKQAIIDVGGWKKKQPCCQEHELYLRLLQANKQFSYFKEAASVYRQWSETTLSKQDQNRTYRYRLEITNQAEAYLERTQQLTVFRQNAINQARFECARIIWLTDKSWSKAIIQQISDRDLSFMPTGHCAPEIYRLMYQFFGFDFAETVAAFKRSLMFT